MTTVEHVLQAWREAERMLDSLPPTSPDHESVALAVARLRETYQTLTSQQDDLRKVIASSEQTVRDAHTLLDGVYRKVDTYSK